MRLKLLWIAIPISFFSLLIGCSDQEESTEDTDIKYVHIPPSVPDWVYSRLAPGDCIMRKGNGPLSFHIMNNTKEEYTHCGIIVHEGEEWNVIHTLGGSASEESIDGVQKCSVDEFVKYAADSMLFICRPVFEDSTNLGDKIAARAYHYLEEETPFDHRFSLFSQDELYCSELLFYVFRDVHGENIFDIEKKHKSYMLMFSTFFDTSRFTPVYHLKFDSLSMDPKVL